MAQFASNILFSIDTALQIKGGVNIESISAQKNLTNRDSTVQFITPTGGTQTVLLPPVRDGLSFLICNLSAAEVLKVRTNTDVGLEDLAASNGAAPGKSSIYCWSDGAVWACMIVVSYSGFSA